MTKISQRIRFATATVAVPVLLAGLVGCAAEPVDQGDPGATELKFGLTSTSSLAATGGLLLQADPSIAESHGLSFEFIDFGGNSANCWTAVIASEVDVCLGGPDGVLFAAAQGEEISVLGNFAYPISQLVVSAKFANEKGITEDSPIEERLAALDGARIATAQLGAGHPTYLQKMLDEVGLTLSGEVEHITLLDPTAMMEGMRADRFEGAMWSMGSLEPLVVSGEGLRLISIPRGDYAPLSNALFNVVGAKPTWIEENPEIVDALYAALQGSLTSLHQDSENASQKLKNMFFPNMDPAVFAEAFSASLPGFPVDPAITRAAWDQMVEIQQISADADLSVATYDKHVAQVARK